MVLLRRTYGPAPVFLLAVFSTVFPESAVAAVDISNSAAAKAETSSSSKAAVVVQKRSLDTEEKKKKANKKNKKNKKGCGRFTSQKKCDKKGKKRCVWIGPYGPSGSCVLWAQAKEEDILENHNSKPDCPQHCADKANRTGKWKGVCRREACGPCHECQVLNGDIARPNQGLAHQMGPHGSLDDFEWTASRGENEKCNVIKVKSDCNAAEFGCKWSGINGPSGRCVKLPPRRE